MIDLKKKPFNLKDSQQKEIKKIVEAMSIDEKIGQLLCPQLSVFSEELVNYYIQVLNVGSFMIRPFEVEGLKENIQASQNKSKLPLLVAANLENGGNGAILEGTLFANPMGVAATGDAKNAYRLGKIACGQASAVGVNWGFAPIIDIDSNYHNPITNVRTFGNDKDKVLEFAREYMKAATEEGVTATIKHFPGDGQDERDQHLLVSVNDLSFEDWMNSYGKVYKDLIDEGAASVMVGHIAAPSVAKELSPDISETEMYLPGTQSKTLISKLLRQKLGFNGVVVTDSTLMVGYMQSMPRAYAIPYSIECGVDIILFNRAIEEDVRFLKEGVEKGILSKERLDEAVTRVLALKMSKGLFEKRNRDVTQDVRQLIQSEETNSWVKDCANAAITLVKDTREVLPLSPKKTKRIYLNVIEGQVKNNSAFAKDIKSRLEREGFKVTLRRRKYNFDPNNINLNNITPAVKKVIYDEALCDTANFTEKYDMAMIVINLETASNATVVRVNWNVLFGMGNDLPWYSGEMPLLVVSTCNPYHLLDVPMAHAYINTYTNNEAIRDALFEKLMGRSEFQGVSPVDAFCGKTDTRI